MSSTNGAGVGRPMFSEEKRHAIMAQVVGKPSGAIVKLGGFDVDLVAIPFAKDKRIAAAAQSIGAIFDGLQAGKIGNSFAEIAPLVVQQYDEIKTLLKEIVKDSVEIAADGDEVFDAWFDALPMIPTIRALLKTTLDANGMTDLGNALATIVGQVSAKATAATLTGVPSPSETSAAS